MVSRRASWSAGKRRRPAASGHFVLLTVGITVLTMLPGLATAASSGSITVSPPYGGSWSKIRANHAEGCSGGNVTERFHFNQGTGIVRGAASVGAHSCRFAHRSIPTSTVFIQPTAHVGMPLPVPASGAHRVSLNVSLGLSGNVSETIGKSTGACGAATVATDSVGSAYFNGTSTTIWPHLSGPIVYNNSTLFQWHHDYGANSECLSEASLTVEVLASVYDATSKITYLPTTAFGSNPSGPVFMDVRTLNITSWSCSNGTAWNFGVWQNSSLACLSSNQTTVTISNLNGVIGGQSRLSTSGLDVGTIQIPGVFNASDAISLSLTVGYHLFAEITGWQSAQAAADVNMASPPNGFQLVSVTIG